jgi:hypothetical protein
MSESQANTNGEGRAGLALQEPVAPARENIPSRWPRYVWAGFAAAFLVFLLVGTVPARIWRLGALHVDTKSIARTWMVQLDHLPDVRFQGLVQASFVVSLLVFVIGVVVAFRLLLAPDDVTTSDQAKRV